MNPAKLAPSASSKSACNATSRPAACSLPHSIHKPGRGPFSYTPGQPLAEFKARLRSRPGKEPAVEVAGGAYRLRQSQCFLKSEGKLRCTTCHDPHDIPRGPTPLAHYNQVCAGCHTAPAGPQHTAPPTASGCHMPKTRTDDAVHIVITDHRIQRRPLSADLTAAKAETHETPATSYRGPVVPYYPAKADPLYEAVAQIRDRQQSPGRTPAARVSRRRSQSPPRAGFYVDLGEGVSRVGTTPRALSALSKKRSRRSPDSS